MLGAVVSLLSYLKLRDLELCSMTGVLAKQLLILCMTSL